MEEVVGFDRRDGQAPHAAVGADEVGHEGRGRPAEDFARRVVLLEHAALGEHGDPVAQLGRLLDVVRDEDDGLLELRLQVEELLLQALPGDRVDGAERLVHQQDRRIAAEGPGHADPLALAARELVWEAPPVVVGVEPDQLEQLVHPGRRPEAGPSRADGAPWRRCRPPGGAGRGRPAGSRSRCPGAAGPGRSATRPSRRSGSGHPTAR